MRSDNDDEKTLPDSTHCDVNQATFYLGTEFSTYLLAKSQKYAFSQRYPMPIRAIA
jgi:hypothetical protein